MDRKQIIVVAALAVGFLGWRLGAMQEGESSQKNSEKPSGSIEPQHVIIETRDDLQTPIDIKTARRFGYLNNKIEQALTGEQEKLYFLGEIEIVMEKQTLEKPIEIPFTKPVLDELLQDLPRILNVYQRYPVYVKKMHSSFMVYVGNKERARNENIQQYIQRIIDYFNAAYFLDNPGLTAYYGYLIGSCLGDNESLELLNNDNHVLVNIVNNNGSDELKKYIIAFFKENMMHMKGEVSSDDAQNIDTIDKVLLTRLLMTQEANQVRPSRWAYKTWNTMSTHDQEIFRYLCEPQVAVIEGRIRLNIGEIKRPVRRLPPPEASSSSRDNQ